MQPQGEPTMNDDELRDAYSPQLDLENLHKEQQ